MMYLYLQCEDDVHEDFLECKYLYVIVDIGYACEQLLWGRGGEGDI